MRELSGWAPTVRKQGEKLFLAGPGKHRWQADEKVAVIDPGVKTMTLTGRQQAEMDRRRTTTAVAAHVRALLDRLNALLKECLRDPFRGMGKPEPLGRNLSGWWSRRINREHRLVYRVTGKGEAQALEVAQCRYHY